MYPSTHRMYALLRTPCLVIYSDMYPGIRKTYTLQNRPYNYSYEILVCAKNSNDCS